MTDTDYNHNIFIPEDISIFTLEDLAGRDIRILSFVDGTAELIVAKDLNTKEFFVLKQKENSDAGIKEVDMASVCKDCEMYKSGFNDSIDQAISDPPETINGQPLKVYSEVALERGWQIHRFGGVDHDDKHTINEWHQIISDYNGWARRMADMGAMDKARNRYVQIAAIAIAAVESVDRYCSRLHCNDLNPNPDYPTGIKISHCGSILGVRLKNDNECKYLKYDLSTAYDISTAFNQIEISEEEYYAIK